MPLRQRRFPPGGAADYWKYDRKRIRRPVSRAAVLAFAAILVWLVLLAGDALLSPAAAQAACARRDQVVAKLSEGYGEEAAGAGLQSATSIYEVWFSVEKGTWTILMSRADGITCIMASGTNWRDVRPEERRPRGRPG